MLSSFTIDNIQLMSGNYTLTEAEGLEAPERRVNAYETPGEDGGVVGSALYGMRLVTLSGSVSAPNTATHETARTELAEVCRIRKSNTGFPVLTRFQLQTLGGQLYFFDGFVRNYTCPVKHLTLSFYKIDVVVPDSAMYALGQFISSQVSRPVGGGVEYPITYPAIYGESIGGSFSLANYGSITTWPIVTISNDVTNPVVRSVTTGKSLALNYSTTVGDEIVIDMKNKTITLNGSTNLLSAKTDDSDWFGLIPGDNDFTFSTSSSGDNGTVSMAYYHAYEGV